MLCESKKHLLSQKVRAVSTEISVQSKRHGECTQQRQSQAGWKEEDEWKSTCEGLGPLGPQGRFTGVQHILWSALQPPSWTDDASIQGRFVRALSAEQDACRT